MFRRSVLLISFVFVLALVLTSAARADLVGWWRLDEGTGSTAYDSSGNGNDGTINGNPRWVAGRVGTALDFDGNGDYVDCGNDPIFDITDEITLSIWVNANDNGNGENNCWMGKGDNTYAIKHQTGNYLEFFIYDGSWHSTNYSTDIASLNGEWHHMAGTYDGSELKFYLDGELAANLVYSSTIGTSSNNVTLGENSQATGRYFDGMLDDARIYNEALSAADIKSIMMGGAYAYAFSPDPADGSIHPETWATLSWRAGDFAVSHDVYLGDNFDDVNSATHDSELFRGNLPLNLPYYVAGIAGFAYPDGLVNGTTYYWRIDEVNDANAASPWKGPVWSFLVPPKTAYFPVPADGSKFVELSAQLKWTAGYGAKLHYIVFGDDFDEVSNAPMGAFSGTTSYNPGTLEPAKTYYWRVDESDGTVMQKGDVWSLTTAKQGGGVKAQYYSGMNFQNLVLTRVDPQINFNWGDPGSPDPSVGNDQFSARWTGEVEAAFTETYTFYTNSDDGARLWVNGVQVVDSWVDQSPTEHSGTIDLVAGTTYSLIMEYYENGGGAVAELRWSSPSTPKQLVPQAALSLPVRASAPSPSSGATGTKMTPILKWNPGDYAASHEVYFGTDANAVRNADKSSPEYKGTKALGDESYDPGKLAWFTTYYWRVDEVNAVNPDGPWVGNLWSFTTGDFILIDDFEDYDSGENQIWYAWKDGLGYGALGTDPYYPGNGTGAAVGDETTDSYTEETIVHGGHQSMPLAYDNNKLNYANYSETEKTLTDTRDWTEESVAELSLWFRGYPASTGSFVEAPAGTYTMTGSGADIWYAADAFHYAFKMLAGVGSIVARVQSLDNTNASAKAGVMIRETLAPDSKYAIAAVTPGAGVIAEYRAETGEDALQTGSQTGITAPYWVKLERSISGNFTWYCSADGSAWQMVGQPEPIPMNSNVYIGLAVTAHNAAATCEAVFTNVTITGNISEQWVHQDIGIASNDAEPLYVAVSNSAGSPVVVVHDDPAAVQIDTWTQWVIPLSVFGDQGINLTNVDSIAIGIGTQGNTTIPGGSGKIFIDDIRLVRPAPEPAE
jgi:hypothetical protein